MKDPYKVTFKSWNNVAALYEERFMDVSLYEDSFQSFCQEIPEGRPKLLEIACGPGNITRYLTTLRPDLSIEAVDVAPNMIALARKNNPKVNFHVMDCRTIGSLDLHFDAIMCGFGMPYLSREDCFQLIGDCADILHKDGVLYFSVIEGDYADSRYESGSDTDTQMYVYYHEEGYLRDALHKNGFEILQLVRKAYPRAEKTDSHLIFIVKKTA